ncbi:MAG: helix-turn-helix domain-containing protein [Magnetospiraceae bacterium]
MNGGAVFLPLAGGGLSRLRRAGNPQERLRQFLDGAGAATLAALRHLDQLEAWQERAAHALKGRSGRTPKRLVEILSEWPLVSAPMAEEITGASRAAAQRNLNDFTALGLIREVTGQGRYRVWCASI